MPPEPCKLKPKYHIINFYPPTTLPNTAWYLGSWTLLGQLSFPSVIWSWSGSLGGTWGNLYGDSWCGWSGTSWLVCNSSAVRMWSLECPGPFYSYFTVTVKYQQQNVHSSLSSSTFLTSWQFSWFSKDCGLTDRPSTSYSRFSQKFHNYMACIRYYWF